MRSRGVFRPAPPHELAGLCMTWGAGGDEGQGVPYRTVGRDRRVVGRAAARSLAGVVARAVPGATPGGYFRPSLSQAALYLPVQISSTV
jgi:hypothetical protein